MKRTCISPVCDKPAHSRSMCAAYSARARRTGDARIHEPVVPPELTGARFWCKVEKSDGCWRWLGRHEHDGYALARMPGGNPMRGHKVAWHLTYGPVPEGMQLDHFACDNKWCVNPDHVRPVTPRENTLRCDGPAAFFAARECCDKGHALTGDNLHLRTDGSRKCRRRHAEYMVEYRKQGHQKKRRAA